MNPEEHIEQMLHTIIENTQSIINDNQKQSFGSLEYFLGHIREYRDEKQYLTEDWKFRTPRWLGSMAIRRRKKNFLQTFTVFRLTLLRN